MMQVGAIGIVAFDRFDECRAIFGCAVGSSNVTTVIVKPVEGKDAG
jgi:hypothetical protein